ncbi:MAG: DEAD/DEAH box helicase [Deltaproteobacteria bacterium]|nr:DEAD/DEAH box helicase [Deltaproteobacteria bacterium]
MPRAAKPPTPRRTTPREDALASFSTPARSWFEAVFDAPTDAQAGAWPAVARGEHVLLVAPTGSGKTLAAFLAALDRLMFAAPPGTPTLTPHERRRGAPMADAPRGTRIVYVSPIKALGVDVEKNLVAPLVGLREAALRLGVTPGEVRVAVRSGDTTAAERRAIARGDADILITTPESLYLLLTSKARDALRGVETVIIDEIHALVPNERGAHLSLSLERLEVLTGRPVQRIGLSATQRPLDEVARFLAGARPVTLVDASAPKSLDLRIEVPFAEPTGDGAEAHLSAKEGADALDDEDVSLNEDALFDGGAAGLDGGALAPVAPSTWDRIFPRLLEQVRAHRSTLIFVNSRRLAERTAQAVNELAGEVLVHAHHGSLAREQRAHIEGELKRGALRGLVATSSLELGIDMGALDCVLQIEAPPSVASGLQRIGRASHHVGGVSRGVVIPKHRGELAACASVADGMMRGEVEAIRYPRNPLDVLAQQLVAMVAMDAWRADDLYRTVQRSASFAELPRHLFESTLDMLSGVYPVEELADLRPRVTYDRATGELTARETARRVAVTSGGTIADRGLYGVYLAGATGAKGRVGELDEEMVFETKPGDRFILGASTWRVEEITHDRVVVSPAPGEPGRMPFWRGENSMRPVELGRRIGELHRSLEGMPLPAAHRHLVDALRLAPAAADALLEDLHAQRSESAVPTDRRIVIEVSRDDLGDARVCVLCPLGARVLAPWAMLAERAAESVLGFPLEALWTNDGFVVRVPEGSPLTVEGDVSWLFPRGDEITPKLTELVAGTSMFAARFREAAARALLLPRKRPGQRTPLWQIRKRAQDLLRGAQRLHDFPILLETYRKCLTDVFDLEALRALLDDVASGATEVVTREVDTPSVAASNVLFGYVANFLYEGDAPVLERRAAALAIDPARLRELMGDVSLRELLDPDVLAELERELVRADHPPSTLDGWHDRLLYRGDVTDAELDADARPFIAKLIATRRALRLRVHGSSLVIPSEYASRYRDALGVPLPPGLPEAFLTSPPEPLRDLVVRYAKTRGPFERRALGERYGVSDTTLDVLVAGLVGSGALFEGEFRPGGAGRELVHAEVLAALRRRSLDRLRRRIAPVSTRAYVRFLHGWHGVSSRRAGLDALLDAVERLEGVPLLASQLESEVLPARVARYSPHDLDTLAAAGEVVWRGVGASGERDGRLALYLADHASLHERASDDAARDPLEARVLEHLEAHGASFFASLHASLGGFAGDLVRALWSLTFRGLVANDGFRALRERLAGSTSRRGKRRKEAASGLAFRSRRTVPRAAEGRWHLVLDAPTGATERATARVRRWLARHGVVTKEVVDAEGVVGGFAGAYPILRALEDGGQVLRGRFVEGIAALQYATSAALDRLRAEERDGDELALVTLAANDPASPFGSVLPWPLVPDGDERPRRVAGTHVVSIGGDLVAYLSRGLAEARVWLPEEEPARTRKLEVLAPELVRTAHLHRADGDFAELALIDARPAGSHALAPFLLRAGMVARGSALTLPRASTRRVP